MPSVTRSELEDRYERLNQELERLYREREEFVKARTREISGSREDISGYFSASSVHGQGGNQPLSFLLQNDEEAKQGVLAQVEASDEYQRLTDELSSVEADLDEVWELAAKVIVDDERTKKENIGRLWESFGEDVPNDRVVEAVGCHDQYPGRLEFDPGSGTVDYREHVKRRKSNQIRTEQRREILERDDHACVRCGESGSVTVHHINPVQDGGSSAKRNLAVLCSECHDKAHDARGSGGVIYDTRDEFWGWVKGGDRGFDPHQTNLNRF